MRTASSFANSTKMHRVPFARAVVLVCAISRMLFRKALLAIWRGYKLFISPVLGNSCRFYPTCSHYAYLLLANENPFRAVGKIAYRVLRCQPFSQGGVDYPIIAFRPSDSGAGFRLDRLHDRDSMDFIVYWLVPLHVNQNKMWHVCMLHPCLYAPSRIPCMLIPTFRSINEKR